MQGDGESKKQTRLAWMEKLLIGVSLLLLVGFGAVLFGVPFLNDAVIRKAQTPVAPLIVAVTDPRLFESGISSTFKKGEWMGKLGQKCPMKTIAVTLDVDTQLNRRTSELLAAKLKESGEFERVQFFDTNEIAFSDFDRWVSVHIDEASLSTSLERRNRSDGKPVTIVEVKYAVIAEPTNQTLHHQEFPLADPLVNVDDGIEMKIGFAYPGVISLEDIRRMLPEKLAVEISGRIQRAREQHTRSFGELPSDLPTALWPAKTPINAPTVLNDFPHRQVRSTHGFLTSNDTVWIIEVPFMELRDFYRRVQSEFSSKGYAELSKLSHPINLNEDIFRIPGDSIAITRSPDHNDFWEVYPAPRTELIGVDEKIRENAIPVATTRLYLHYTRMLSKSVYRNLINQLAKAPDVSLEKVLMFREELMAVDKKAYEDLLKRFQSPENDLLLSLVRFETASTDMGDDERRNSWKQLFIRLLKEQQHDKHEWLLSKTINQEEKEEIYKTVISDLRAAGIPEVLETSSISVKLRPGEAYSAILTNPKDEVSIAKTFIGRLSADGIRIQQVIQTSTGHSSIFPLLSLDGKKKLLDPLGDDFKLEGTAKITDATTGEVEVILKKGKP